MVERLLAVFGALIDDAVSEEERPLVEALLFGEGGVYDARVLALHQALLQELGATLDSLARDIDMLGSAVALLLREDPASLVE